MYVLSSGIRVGVLAGASPCGMSVGVSMLVSGVMLLTLGDGSWTCLRRVRMACIWPLTVASVRGG